MRKIIVLVSMVLLIGTCIIGSTLAWLTATTKELTNTFTAGNITIDLEEYSAKNTDGTWGVAYPGTDEETVVVEGVTKPILAPGDVVNKMPVVKVEKGSEKCYVFVQVTNTMTGKNDKNVDCSAEITYNEGTGATQWTCIDTDKNIWMYNSPIDASKSEDDIYTVDSVFSKVTLDGASIDKTALDTISAGTISMKAYAHQAEAEGEELTLTTIKANAISYFGA